MPNVSSSVRKKYSFTAIMLFHPFSYYLIATIGWNLVYGVYSFLVFILGTFAVLVFLPKEIPADDTRSPQEVKRSVYQTIEPTDEKWSNKAVATFSVLWTTLSFFLCFAYYTMFLFLVRIHFI